MSETTTRIQLCGRLAVQIEGEHVESALPGRQGRLLFAYLAINRDRPVRRDELVQALWSDEGQPPSGEALLRPPLSRLRKALGPGRLEGRGEVSLVLPDDAVIDWESAVDSLARTRAALSTGEWKIAWSEAHAALEVADRGLLPGLEADWIEERRRELADMRIEALEAIAASGVRLGSAELPAAERAARAAVEAAPFRESARLALMEALRAAGNVAEAMRAFDELRIMLRDELGTSPGPKVMALYDRLLHAEQEPRAAEPPAPAPLRAAGAAAPIVERDSELSRLGELVGDATAGEGRVALVEGPAGIGKSRLLAEAREHAAAQGTRVVAARGTELEREFPYGVVRQLFEALILDPEERERALAGAAAPAHAVFAGDAQNGDGAGDVSFAALHSLFWLVVNLSADRPLVLAIDDLHWADRASLRFVAYLTPRLEGLPVLVATTVRTGESATDEALLAEIAQDPGTASIRPRPLSRVAVTELVRARLGGDADDSFCSACHRVTVGNPLLVRQLLSALESDEIRPLAENTAVVREIGPGAVSRGIVTRVERLGGEAQAVARAVAILGESADLPAIAGLSQLDERVVAESAAALARAEILRPERPPGFVHPLVRDAVYHDMGLGTRELQHAAAARMLADSGAPAEQAAAHLLLVARRGESWISDTLAAAAHAAMRKGAPDSAVAYLRRALEEPPPAGQRPYMLFELGVAEAMTNGPAAAEHLQAAYEGLEDPVERAAVAEMLGRAHVFTGDPAAGAAVAREAAAALPPERQDERERLEALDVVTRWFGVGGEPDEQLLAAWREPPAPDAGVGRKMITAMAGLDIVYRGRPVDAGVELASACARAMIEADNGLLSCAAINALACADRDEAMELWEVATADAHGRGSLFSMSSVHLWRGYTHLHRGEIREAEAMLRTATDSFALYGYNDQAVAYLVAFLSWALVERGDVAGAREQLMGGKTALDNSDALRFWLESEVGLMIAEGKFDEAIEAADAILRLFPVWTAPTASRARPLKIQALLALGRLDDAREVAEEELERARRSGAPTGLGRALRLLGTVEGEDGFEHLQEAIDVLAPSTSKLEHAKALAALAAQQNRAGLTGDAAENYVRALELGEVLGAGALAAETRARLREMGVEPMIEPPTGIAALTHTERRVAALAAEGQSQRDIAQAMFVTPNAIEHQLGDVYRKLGVTTPDELATALAA